MVLERYVPLDAVQPLEDVWGPLESKSSEMLRSFDHLEPEEVASNLLAISTPEMPLDSHMIKSFSALHFVRSFRRLRNECRMRANAAQATAEQIEQFAPGTLVKAQTRRTLLLRRATQGTHG